MKSGNENVLNQWLDSNIIKKNDIKMETSENICTIN